MPQKLTFSDVWRELGKPENWKRDRAVFSTCYSDCIEHKDGYYIYAETPVHFWTGHGEYVYCGFFTHLIYGFRARSLLKKVKQRESKEALNKSSNIEMLGPWDMI